MIKGDLSDRQVVKQLGFVEETLKKRTIIEDLDQPLLRPGTEALLTLGFSYDGTHTVVAGPKSVVTLRADRTARAALREARAPAARQARPVRDGSGTVVLPVKNRPIR